MSIARSTFRYFYALTLGLLLNALLFSVLWNITATSFEPATVVATRLDFTRVRQDTEPAIHHEDETPALLLPEVPAIPRLETPVLIGAHDPLPRFAPDIDISAAFEDARSALSFESDAIAILRIPPSYPRPARMARIQGYVTMEVGISPEGIVTEVTVVEAVPPRMFDIAAMDAMKRWKFRPKFVNGVAVGQRAQQTIEFKIEG